MASTSANASVSIPRITLTRPTVFNPVRFTPVAGTVQTPDLNILANSLKEFEQRRYMAAESMSKVNASIAKIRELVNDDEGTQNWLTNLTGETVDKMQSSIDNGNYGQAIFDSIQLATDIFNRPDVVGRINATKSYKDELTRVQHMADNGLISQDIFEQWKEENPFYYFDRYEGESDDIAKENRLRGYNYEDDPSKKIVGGTKWTPVTGAPVRTVDVNSLMDDAIKMVLANAEESTSSTIYYKTADGKFTDRPELANPANPYPWYQTDNGFKQVTREQLKQAMRTAINTRQDAKASIAQDLSNGLWKMGKTYNKVNGAYVDDNGRIVDNEFTDDNGLALDVNTYIESLIDPKARIMAKTVRKSKVTFGKGMDFDAQLRLKALEEAKNKDKKGSSSSNALYDIRVPRQPVTYTDKRLAIDGLFATQGKMDIAAASITELAKEAGIEYDRNTSIEELWGKIPSVLKTQEAMDIYDSYIHTKQLIEDNIQFNENADAKYIIDSMRFMSAYNNGYAIDKNNSYYGDYMSKLNDLFIDKSSNKAVDEIYIPLIWNNYDFSSSLKPQLEKEFEGSIKFDETGKYIVVNRNDRLILPKLIDKIEGYEQQSGTSGYAGGGPYRGSRSTATHTLRFDTQYKDENGVLHPFNRTPVVGGNFGNSYDDTFKNLYKQAEDRINKLMDGEDNSLRYSINPDDPNKTIRDYGTINTQFVPFTSFGNAMVASLGADKQEVDANIEVWQNRLKAYNPTNERLFLGMAGRAAVEITNPDDRRLIWNILGSDDYYVKHAIYGYDPLSYDSQIHIGTSYGLSQKTRQQINDIVSGYLEDSGIKTAWGKDYDINQPLDVILPDVDLHDPIRQQATASPDYIGNLRITQYHAAHMYNVPLTQNVILNIENNTLSLRGGTPIPLAEGVKVTEGVEQRDRDASTRMLLGYQDLMTSMQRSYGNGDNKEEDFENAMKEYIGTALGKGPESTDVKAIVTQIVNDTKSLYNIK